MKYHVDHEFFNYEYMIFETSSWKNFKKYMHYRYHSHFQLSFYFLFLFFIFAFAYAIQLCNIMSLHVVILFTFIC